MNNPLIDLWDTPFKTPPFHKIKITHFRPAVDYAIKAAGEEINSISENPDKPDFENSVAALDRAGQKLAEISSVLFNLNSAETCSELQSAAQEISPILTRFSNDITLNSRLFRRIKSVYDSRDSQGLSIEQQMLLEKHYRNFILGGSGLKENERRRFREISEELSLLTLKFEENVLDETNSFELLITRESDLSGLPSDIIEMASAEAGKRGKKGWLFTLKHPSYIPFMQHCNNRDLRKIMLKAYSSRAYNGNEKDNSSLVLRIVNLRLEMARLLGFSNYAEMILGDRMAENPSIVNKFLEDLFSASRNAALRDFENLKNFAEKCGQKDNIERWDWAYYSEKLKKARYDIDDEILKPYLSLNNVREAVFELASRLFELRFVKNTLIPVYHKEVETWEVHDKEGSLLAILYLDHFPRPGKNGGAWMTSFRDQKTISGKNIRPLISIVTNFTRPTKSKPSLLTFNELITFLHEFGHALHGMLSQCTYESLSGTNVARDFVELPSQFMQNWAYEQEWLDSWAIHYKTGRKIPAKLITRIREASTFNEGYACQRQIGFGFIDMAWHTLSEPPEKPVNEFEESAKARTELFPGIDSTCMSCSFTHLFSGGYAAGYYGYKWAEVLDADAFRYFKEVGIFNGEIAESYRKNILEKGGSDKPMNLFVRFRGREPDLNALLERSGLK